MKPSKHYRIGSSLILSARPSSHSKYLNKSIIPKTKEIREFKGASASKGIKECENQKEFSNVSSVYNKRRQSKSNIQKTGLLSNSSEKNQTVEADYNYNMHKKSNKSNQKSQNLKRKQENEKQNENYFKKEKKDRELNNVTMISNNMNKSRKKERISEEINKKNSLENNEDLNEVFMIRNTEEHENIPFHSITFDNEGSKQNNKDHNIWKVSRSIDNNKHDRRRQLNSSKGEDALWKVRKNKGLLTENKNSSILSIRDLEIEASEFEIKAKNSEISSLKEKNDTLTNENYNLHKKVRAFEDFLKNNSSKIKRNYERKRIELVKAKFLYLFISYKTKDLLYKLHKNNYFYQYKMENQEKKVKELKTIIIEIKHLQASVHSEIKSFFQGIVPEIKENFYNLKNPKQYNYHKKQQLDIQKMHINKLTEDPLNMNENLSQEMKNALKNFDKLSNYKGLKMKLLENLNQNQNSREKAINNPSEILIQKQINTTIKKIEELKTLIEKLSKEKDKKDEEIIKLKKEIDNVKSDTEIKIETSNLELISKSEQYMKRISALSLENNQIKKQIVV